LGERKHLLRFGDGGGDDDDPLDAHGARTREHRRRLGGIEVRMGVDHAAAGASMRGNSGSAPLMLEAASRRAAAGRGPPSPDGGPRCWRMGGGETGRYDASATAAMRSPSASVCSTTVSS